MVKEKKSSSKKYVSIFSFIILIWLIFMIIMFWSANNFEFVFPPSTSIESLGVFGDSFNILTSLFTGLAFAGVIISVILQTKELEETRNELSGQRQEFKLQRQQFEEQNLHARYNRLHNLLSETYYNTEYTKDAKNYKGLSSLFQEIRMKPSDMTQLKNMDIIFKFMTTYHFIEKELDSILDNYADSQQIDIIRNIKKEFILQWRDVYASCLRSYTLVSLVFIKNEDILKFYLNIDFIQPMINNKSELVSVSREGASSQLSSMRKYVESIDYTKDISNYFNMEYLDFNIVV